MFMALPRRCAHISSQAAERGKFLDSQPSAHFRMSASRSLWDLNSSRLYISSQKTFS